MKSLSIKLGLVTLLVFGLGGILLVYFFQERAVLTFLIRGDHWWIQVLLGSVIGVLSGLLVLRLLSTSMFNEERHGFYRLVKRRLSLQPWSLIFISLCAGIGEELFFRAGLQFFLGIWPTAILFVALHGYYSFHSFSTSLYGVLMTFLIAGFGHLYCQVGLISAIMAHASFDFIILKDIRNYALKPPHILREDINS